MAEKICGVYKITNTVTGDFYIGSSKNVKHRWANHKCPSSWNEQPNNPMYQDMRKYGLNNFEFQVIAEVEPEQLKKKEQEFIEKMHPIYNVRRANGWDTDKFKKCQKKYIQSEKGKKCQKKYRQSEKGKKCQKKYNNQLCCFNGEILTLNALRKRFMRRGIPHSTFEAKKYLIKD